MKKLVAGSLAFVFALTLSTSVFADRTLSITEYCGDNGLIDRGNDPVQKGDTLNIKNNIKQDTDSATYGPEENRILGQGIVINGGGHTLDGNGFDGFKMARYDSGNLDDANSEINNTKLTNYNGNAIEISNPYSSYCKFFLTLKNVHISSNSGNSISLEDADLLVSNVHALDGISGNGNLIVGNGKDAVGPLVLGGDSGDFNGNLTVDNATISLLPEASYFGESTHNFYKNGTLNLANNYIDDAVMLSDLQLEGTMKLNIDVDLAEQAIDDVQFGDVYTGEDEQGNPIVGKISLNKINLLSDATSKYTTYTFGEEAKDYIQLASSQKNILGTVFTYKVSYGEEEKGSSDEGGDDNDNLPFTPLQPGGDEGGNSNLPFNPLNPAQTPTTGADAGSDEQEKTALLQFERLGGGDGEVSLDSGEKLEGPINPVFLQSKVAIAASSLSQEEVFDTVLNNAGNYTFFQKQGSNAGDVEDRAAPTLWIKAFGSQEDLDMEDYTKLKTTYYGAVVGLDWDRQYSDNFDATYGIFASYIGGEFKDEDWSEGDFKVKQNGGYVGLRGNWYIGKLFINGILDYGMIQNTADNPYDSSDFNSSVAGLAARVGYNFEVARRRFTIQPSVGATGKYIITDDFETKIKDGNKIKEEIDNITNITIEPGLKLALNLGKCWILSGEGKYVVENFDGDTKVKGEGLDFILPDTSYKNYTNVGLGIEKIWGYTVLHVKGNKTFGGRDGFIINAGIEFKF